MFQIIHKCYAKHKSYNFKDVSHFLGQKAVYYYNLHLLLIHLNFFKKRKAYLHLVFFMKQILKYSLKENFKDSHSLMPSIGLCSENSADKSPSFPTGIPNSDEGGPHAG